MQKSEYNLSCLLKPHPKAAVTAKEQKFGKGRPLKGGLFLWADDTTKPRKQKRFDVIGGCFIYY
jgi:hypothetical protein